MNNFIKYDIAINKLKIAKTKDTKTPERGTSHSAGIDFYIPNTWNESIPYYIGVGENVVIPMGIYVDLIGSGLKNYALRFDNKSGIAVNKGLIVGACLIDADYQGELMVDIHNVSDATKTLVPGTKIIQGVLLEVLYAEIQECKLSDLYQTESKRGAGRFGSTGIM